MRSIKLLTCLLLPLLIWGTAQGQPLPPTSGDPLLVINGEEVGLIHLESELATLQSKLSAGRSFDLPVSEDVLGRLIQNRLLEQEGYRIEAEKQPVVRGQVRDFLRLKAVVALLDSVSNGVAQQGQAELDSLLSVSRELRQYSHILVKEETLARSLRDSLEAGVPFADLARRHSTDGTAATGGTLGWVGPGSFVAEFEGAAGKLAIGEITAPVKTQFGWHLITLNDIRLETAGQTDAMRDAMLKAVERENRMAAVRRFVADLKVKHDADIKYDLVAQLEFGSEDVAVIENLRHSDQVIFSVPGYDMTVKDLNREILFTYFHGLSGRDEAAEIRDKVFNEAVDEVLLSREARAQGFDRDPELRLQADLLERRLIREEVVNTLLRSNFREDEEEIRRYYESDPARFSDPARVKLKSVMLRSESAAQSFRERLEQGVQFRWLAERDPGVIRGKEALPSTWVAIDKLGIEGDLVSQGLILGPKEDEEGWIVAVVTAVEAVEIRSLEECRGDVISWMRRDHNRDSIESALDRLRGGATVEIMPDATERVTARLQMLVAADSTTEETAKMPPEGSKGSKR